MKKKLVSIIAIVGFVFVGQAKVLTVSNNVASPGQYTVLQTACDAAVSNDTIYIHGSENDYGRVDITKPLTLIGTGVFAQKSIKQQTTISDIQIKWSSNGSQNGGGSKIFGINLYRLLIIDEVNSTGIKNILIQRNRISQIEIQGNGVSSNININGNIIGSAQIFPGKSIYIKNNIINNLGGGDRNFVSTLVAANNIIYGRCHLNRSSIYNNIFTSYGSKVFEGCEYSSITRNLVSGKINYTNADIVFGTNTGGENILNEDPMFVDANSSPMDYGYTSKGPFADYHLSAGSPAIGAGIGGVDLGIYGGDTPFFEGASEDGRNRYFPMPAIPVMLDMNIVNSSLLKTSKLKVEFKARKQD